MRSDRARRRARRLLVLRVMIILLILIALAVGVYWFMARGNGDLGELYSTYPWLGFSLNPTFSCIEGLVCLPSVE